MLSRWLTRRGVARAAAVGLAVGVLILSGLGMLCAMSYRVTTTNVTAFNNVSSHWNSAFVALSAEEATLQEFMSTNGSPQVRRSLITVHGGAQRDLDWLVNRAEQSEGHHVQVLQANYTSYLKAVDTTLSSVGDASRVIAYGDLAKLLFLSVKDQVVANIERKQHELAAYLVRSKRYTDQMVMAMVTTASVELLLCCISLLSVLAYQRRSEQDAARSLKASLHDPLTGLANRQLLTQCIERRLASPDTEMATTSLLLIDLNKFKQVNDTLGHHCGDLLLQEVAKRLIAATRQNDLVVRLGGDEFAILMPDVESREQTVVIASRVATAICAPMELEGRLITISASVGGAVYPLDCDTMEGLLHHADMAMYSAKRSGNQVDLHGGMTRADDDPSQPELARPGP
jgi:diguanylate cyclase